MIRLLLAILLFSSTGALLGADAKERGLSAWLRQDYESAIPLLQNALRSDPEDPELLLALGLSFLAVNNEPLGVPLLERLSKERSETGLKASLALAAHHAGRKRPTEAAGILSTAWSVFPGRIEVFRAYAAVLESSGRTEDLLVLLQDPSAPGGIETGQKRISLLLSLGRTNAARSVAESWPAPEGQAELKAWVLRKTGKTSEALLIYRELYRTTKDPRFGAEGGRTLIESGDTARAGRFVLETVQPAPGAIRVLKDLALYDALINWTLEQERSSGTDQSRELIPLFEAVSRWDDLLDRLVRHLELSSDTAFVLPRVMDLVFLRDKKRETILHLETAATNLRDPAAAGRVLSVLAEIHLRTGDRKQAFHAAERSLRAAGLAGFALRCANDFNDRNWSLEADQLLKAVLTNAARPEDRAEALLGLARIAHGNGDENGALELLDRFGRDYPEWAGSERPRRARAAVLGNLGRFDAALEILDRMDQKDPEVLLRSALCLHMTGKSARALALCRQAGRAGGSGSAAAVLEGVILLEDREKEKAEEAFRRAASAPLPDPSSLNGLIELHVLTSVLKGTNGLGSYGRGLTAFTAGRYEEAAAVFGRFAEKPGPHASFFLYRSAVSLALGRLRPEEAARALDTVRKDKDLPTFVRSHAAEVRADLSLSAGRNEEALGLYKDILLDDPRYARQSVIRDRINRLKAE